MQWHEFDTSGESGEPASVGKYYFLIRDLFGRQTIRLLDRQIDRLRGAGKTIRVLAILA
jgi:hypothetical protein